jgi:starch-binding outer membrane protein, SusD/RagB family
MIMKNFKIFLVSLILLVINISCINELETEPKGQDKNLDQLLAEQPTLGGLVSKVYGSLALSGASGPASTDTPGDDAGESPFLRGIINLQDFTADAMKNRWGDNGLDELTTTSRWDENNKFFRYMYNRIYYTVPQANNVIRQLNNIDFSNKEQVISEMRFLRALSYYYLIDCFGKGPILTENDIPGVLKAEASRSELFNFVESELLQIEAKLPANIGYGRANKSVVRTLLAKLYLNAKVYTGTARYSDALIYSKKVIDEGGYSLATDFQSIFSGDNDLTNAKNEIIYALIADPLVSQSYGNTTYLVNGSLNDATMNLGDYGATAGWGGHRASKGWYGLFGADAASLATSNDKRAKLFFSNYLSSDPTKKHSYEMTDYKKWTDGFPCTKYRNSNFLGNSVNTEFSGVDFPLYRLADIYLMYAEAHLRGGGGSASDALQYVNAIRTRAGAALISGSQLDLNFIIDERGRELNFEGHRRTDLIRFDKFTGGDYLWPWKGNALNGSPIPAHYSLFPIPLKALQANPNNLTQNLGYN